MAGKRSDRFQRPWKYRQTPTSTYGWGDRDMASNIWRRFRGNVPLPAVRERLGLDGGPLAEFMSNVWCEYLGTANTELIGYVRRWGRGGARGS
jgi:hypothetical protein